jgi:environmental stress-induced protein Ves
MSATLIRPEEYRVMRWRNGQGTTTEIAVVPAAADRFRWRLSIADVASSGPFSDFSGYDRVIAVASGAGMRLAVAGREPVVLTQESEPYAFPGDAATECTLLEGPIRDFNLMIDRATTRGMVAALRFLARPPVHRAPAAGSTVLLHALRGRLALGSQAVSEGATLRLDDAEASALAVDADPGSVALWVEIVAAHG